MPELLHWCTLTPEGPSSLAAVRFAALFRVSSLRVFPSGVQPFSQSPDIIARTEPSTFFLEVFFNAQPVPQPDSKDRQRATNALAPTIIAYAGGQVDFTVDMGSEYATRLMIVKGKFDAVSLAIYGEIVADTPTPVPRYQPCLLPSVEPVSLSKVVDPSNLADPTLPAKQLLNLLPDSPPLPLVVRLMFCLKPSDEDWDLPEFPYLHADLDVSVGEEVDLETLILYTSKPVRDDASYDSLARFATMVASRIGPKSSDEAYQVALLLSISASQHPGMARAILEHIDIASIFDVQTIEEATVLRLLDAVTNVDIARHLGGNDHFLGVLTDVQGNSRFDKSTQLAAKRLSSRVQRWSQFEDALSNTRGDFNESSNLLKDIGAEEQSLGIWLESMIIHEDIVTKLAENPVLPAPHVQPPFLLRGSLDVISHDDFVTFVRAYIGVGSVLAVWAWADSLGNDDCRERALAILHLWQGVDGYREIINHLLLLRQLTRRLEWIIADKDPPRKSGFLAEKILADLAKDPHAILHDDLVQTILSLKPPLSFIAESERLSMRKVALVAEDGLSAAVEELMFNSDHPLSLRRLRTLRVSLAIVEQDLEGAKGEWLTTQTFWEEQSHGMGSRLVDLFVGISGDLGKHFSASSLPKMNQTLAGQLFLTGDDLLRLITRLIPNFPLTGRGMRDLTVAAADAFTCTDTADMTYTQTSSTYIASQVMRQTCLDLVQKISASDYYAQPGRLGAEVCLRTLLEHGGRYGDRDPVYHLLQVFTMIDHILPIPNTIYEDDTPSYWVTAVFPKVLGELKYFFSLLDTENKVHLIKRLVQLDGGTIGLGEWLVLEEMKRLVNILEALSGGLPQLDHLVLLQHQVSVSLHLLLELILPSSTLSAWCLTSLTTSPDMSETLNRCLLMILDGCYMSPHLQRFVEILTVSSSSFNPEVAFTILLAALRILQDDSTPRHIFDTALDILVALPSVAFNSESLRLEIGQTLSFFASQTVDTEMAKCLLKLFIWLTEQENRRFTTLRGMTPTAFSKLCDVLDNSLLPEDQAIFVALRPKFTLDEDEEFVARNVVLPLTLELPLQSIADFLNQNIPSAPPATPKGTKTPDILGVVISPPTALLRSPATTGLTKTYANNDFRQLRQTPSARQNTSRLPSMHGVFPLLPLREIVKYLIAILPVDDFQGSTSMVPTESDLLLDPNML